MWSCSWCLGCLTWRGCKRAVYSTHNHNQGVEPTMNWVLEMQVCACVCVCACACVCVCMCVCVMKDRLTKNYNFNVSSVHYLEKRFVQYNLFI